jgi:hypothetical protein
MRIVIHKTKRAKRRLGGIHLSVIVFGFFLLALTGPALQPAGAFWESIHEEMTHESLDFLRPVLRYNIGRHNIWNDHGIRVGEDQRHCDDCEFNKMAAYINENYLDAIYQLTPAGDFDPWEAAEYFGRLTHPAQDFYSHSNWIELGFPVCDDPLTTNIVENVKLTDLYDYSWAPFERFDDWFEPSADATFREDGLVRIGRDNTPIVLDHDDIEIVPWGWTVELEEGKPHVPILKDENGGTVGKLLNSGQSPGDDECDLEAKSGDFSYFVFVGFEHSDPGCLNKDGPTDADCGFYPEDGDTLHSYLHNKARALATLQTRYEWCRLLYKAGQNDVEGLLLALWVKPDGSPHPLGTPFAPATNPSLKEVTVTVESIKVLHSGDDPDHEPGEVNLSLWVYDSPFHFHRSAHSEVHSIDVRSGEYVPASRLPAPVSLCLGESDLSFTVALHGWDDDDDASAPEGLGDFNGDYLITTNINGLTYTDYVVDVDDDEVLLGFQRSHSVNSGGTFTMTGRDLEVVYRVEVNTDRDSDGLGDCDERAYGTDPQKSDSDNDGLTDGDEVTRGTNPLSSDTDSDGLPDGLEVANGTDPRNADTDHDGIPDGKDVEWLQNYISSLPRTAFKSPPSSTRSAALSILDEIEAAVVAGDEATAIKKLQNLRKRADGCGSRADTNDWIIRCPEQIQLREFIDLSITNISH